MNFQHQFVATNVGSRPTESRKQNQWFQVPEKESKCHLSFVYNGAQSVSTVLPIQVCFTC